MKKNPKYKKIKDFRIKESNGIFTVQFLTKFTWIDREEFADSLTVFRTKEEAEKAIIDYVESQKPKKPIVKYHYITIKK